MEGTLPTSKARQTRGTIADPRFSLLLKVAERQRLGLPHLREHRGAGGSGDTVFPFPSPCVPFLRSNAMNRALVAALAAGLLCIASSVNAFDLLGGSYGACGCDAAPTCGCDDGCGRQRCGRERCCRERCHRERCCRRDRCCNNGCDNSCAKVAPSCAAPTCAAPTCAAVAPTCAAMAPTCEAKATCGCEKSCGRERCCRDRCHRERCCKQRCPRERCHRDRCNRGCNNTCGCEMAAPSCGCGK